MEQAELLRSRLKEIGFDEVRFAQLEELEPRTLKSWLSQGYHADMHWMENSVDKRLNPALVLPGVKSLILLGVNYSDGKTSDASGPRIARYARHVDYHDTIKIGLEKAGKIIEELYNLTSNDYRYYVDTGPVLERAWAAKAGLGFIGKNAMLISREFGNWLLLSAILVRYELPADRPIKKIIKQDVKKSSDIGLLCGKCTRCMDACPTGAFSGPGVVDSRLCISYHTIENKGVIPKNVRERIGDRIFGCDTCLEVCPWNRFATKGRKLLLTVKEEGVGLSLESYLQFDEKQFKALFRKTPLIRLKFIRFIRNVLTAAGNAKRQELFPYVAPWLNHDNNIIRAHAAAALTQINSLDAKPYLEKIRISEHDPLVRSELETLP
jgi:epoxyqueuosine reductase